jgi:hypothetical protein
MPIFPPLCVASAFAQHRSAPRRRTARRQRVTFVDVHRLNTSLPILSHVGHHPSLSRAWPSLGFLRCYRTSRSAEANEETRLAECRANPRHQSSRYFIAVARLLTVSPRDPHHYGFERFPTPAWFDVHDAIAGVDGVQEAAERVRPLARVLDQRGDLRVTGTDADADCLTGRRNRRASSSGETPSSSGLRAGFALFPT